MSPSEGDSPLTNLPPSETEGGQIPTSDVEILPDERDKMLTIVGSEGTSVQLPSGKIDFQEFMTSLASSLSEKQLVGLVKVLVNSGNLAHFRSLVDMLEIAETRSAFEDPEKVTILEETASQYGLSQWANELGKELSSITRADLEDWWDYFTQMAAIKGFRTGTIDALSQGTNLWNATASLAKKMGDIPANYRFLQASLINNPDEVARRLTEINHPIAYLEVLTGEAWEDMCRSDEFLKAFVALSEATTPTNVQEAVVATIKLALSRG